MTRAPCLYLLSPFARGAQRFRRLRRGEFLADQILRIGCDRFPEEKTAHGDRVLEGDDPNLNDGGHFPQNRILDRTAKEMREYFNGRRRKFSLPLLTPGTEFQKAVWEKLQEIPYGETTSYGEMARRLGRRSAVRAVAKANGDNAIAIIIPCHRVVGSDGKLTGYGGGLWRKQRLLEHESGQGVMLPVMASERASSEERVPAPHRD